MRRINRVAGSLLLIMLCCLPLRGAYIWIEGEKPVRAQVHRHPWWYDKVARNQLSGGDMVSNWDEKSPGIAEYVFQAPSAGEYEFWVRANPTGTRLAYKLNDGAWALIDFSKAQDTVNIAADGKIDLRFIAWDRVGEVSLRKGTNTIAFRMDSPNNNHGMLDCFVFSSEPFQPRGILKPAQIARQNEIEAQGKGGWFAFAPPADRFGAGSAFDLRSLNETFAGEGGFIAAKNGQFVHGATGKPVRFWAVNGPPGELKEPAELRACARMLAKHGVNLVRIHGGYFNDDGSVNSDRIQHAIDIVEAMKSEGIYSHFSTYYPIWLSPKAGTPWLDGYDGKSRPFAALYFNPDFQKVYRNWWKALLTTPGKRDGKRLIDDPAVCSLEIINEDSYFFWTFNDKNIPDAELRILETQFGTWLKHKYGSLENALSAWRRQKEPRDNLPEGRIAFRPLWNMSNERTARDRDAAAFLTQSQRDFYRTTYQFLKDLGFKGVITASNWTTASPEYLGPLDKYTYTACDFVDRHGYFGCNDKGPNDGWAIMNDQTYADRSALRFDPEQPGKPKEFVNPVMDIHYDGEPSMISETTFNRPNRYRSEAPLYYACYGALQDSNCIVHFALDGDRWSAKPGFFMQPWTLMSPAMMGQFPAAAMIYREGLVSAGEELVSLDLGVQDLENLKGTPMPQDASFDELRAKDVPQGTAIKPGNVVDPLVHYAGRTSVHFTSHTAPPRLRDLTPYVDRRHQTVTSTTGQLKLDYGKGTLTINAPAAQGISGDLQAAGATELKDLSIHSDMRLGHIVAVSLDGNPLASSRKILLQVMSEEQPSDFKTEPASQEARKILDIGHDPWLVRRLSGQVRFKRPDAAQLRVTALDFNGYPQGQLGSAETITLSPNVTYYLITR